MQWNDDASELRDRYLDEVRRACEERGGDPGPVVGQVDQRLQAQVEGCGVSVVSGDLIRGILAASGSAQSLVRASAPPPLPIRGSYVNPHERGAQTPVTPQVWRGSSSAPAGCFIAAAVCVGIVFLGGIVAAIVVPALTRARDAAYRATCHNNLKEVGLQIQDYAGEHGGNLPALVNEPGYMIFGGEFANGLDLGLLQCPGEGTDYAERNEDGSVYLDSDYIYAGFAVRNQAEMEAVLAAFHAQNNSLEALMALGKIAGPDGDILPLNTGLADPASIPVLVEWYMNHSEDGANVLYLDGHTEFVKHGSKFPVTDEFYGVVEEMVQ